MTENFGIKKHMLCAITGFDGCLPEWGMQQCSYLPRAGLSSPCFGCVALFRSAFYRLFSSRLTFPLASPFLLHYFAKPRLVSLCLKASGFPVLFSVRHSNPTYSRKMNIWSFLAVFSTPGVSDVALPQSQLATYTNALLV